MEVTSREATWRWPLITAVAPLAWGSVYYVTHHFLPADTPLWGATLRALPAGLLLLAISRRLPRGHWWWRSAVLGTLTMGVFFALVYASAQLLPTSTASAVMATSPLAMMALAWPLLAERPRPTALLGGVAGVAGVVLVVAAGTGAVDPLGVLVAASAVLTSALGHLLTKRWSAKSAVGVLPVAAWQLIAGGAVLLVAALALEGPPPALDGPAVLATGYVSIIGTAVAYTAWYTGLKHLDAGSVGLIGLLNPVTGVLLGTALAGEALTGRQGIGLLLVLAGVLLGQPALLAKLTRGGREGRLDRPVPTTSLTRRRPPATAPAAPAAAPGPRPGPPPAAAPCTGAPGAPAPAPPAPAPAAARRA